VSVIRRLATVAAILAPLGLAGGARAEAVGDSVRTVLHDDHYRFCHEDDYPLTPEEHAWCPQVGQVNGACPALAKACKLPPVELLAGRGRFGLRGGRGKANAGGTAADRPPQDDTRRRPWPTFSLPGMSGFAQVLFFGLLAVGLVFVVRLIVNNLLKGRGDSDGEAAAGGPPDLPAGEPAAPRGPIETDVERLLARARAAAARGDYARAIDDAYAALLRRLDGDGLIEIHPSRTNGDYVRRLRDRPELRGPVGAIARDVERVQFGAAPASEPTFRSVLERVIPLATRALALALVLFGLSVTLSCTPHEASGDRGDTSPSGVQAVIDVMGKHGLKVRRRVQAFSTLDHPLALVLLSDVSLDDAAWKQLLEWVRVKGGHLVIAGVTPLPAELEQRIVPDGDGADGGADGKAPLPMQLTVAPGARWVGYPTLSLPPGAHIEPAEGPTEPLDGVVLLRGDLPVVTEQSFGEGSVLIAADDRLFTNVALAVDDDASFLLSALHRASVAPDHEVEIADEWTGAGARSPLESVDHAHLTPVVIQLLVLLALLFLWKGRAFARLRDPPAEARRAFVDHARALGVAYGRARASRHVTGLYAVWAMDRLRERVHRAGRQGLIPLAEAIAARTGRPVGEVMSVLVEAAGARDEAAPPSSFRPTSRRAARESKDALEADRALMRELMSFLTATGQRPRDRNHPPA
jgi:Domain of unknown function (DUF4129)/Domain of unknown function (DUF4350)